jgi:hypothetical protein
MCCVACKVDSAFVVGTGWWVVEESPDIHVLHEIEDLPHGLAPAQVIGEQVVSAGVDNQLVRVPMFLATESDHCILVRLNVLH